MRIFWENGLHYEQVLTSTGETIISIHRHLDGKLLKVTKTRANPDGTLEISVDVPLEDGNGKRND